MGVICNNDRNKKTEKQIKQGNTKKGGLERSNNPEKVEEQRTSSNISNSNTEDQTRAISNKNSIQGKQNDIKNPFIGKDKYIKDEKGGKNQVEIKDEIDKLYSSLDIQRDYYLVWPDCQNCIPHIIKVSYDDKINDFKSFYNCPCDSKSKEKYLAFLFNLNKPSNNCIKHNNSLKFYCFKCEKPICKICRQDHKGDIIKNNNSSNYISDEIVNTLLKTENRKDKFKYRAFLNKFLNKYLNNKKSKANKPIEKTNTKMEEKQAIDKSDKKKEIEKYDYSKVLKSNDKIFCMIQLKSGLLATGSYDGKIRIWIPDEDKPIKEIQEIGSILCLLEFEQDKILSGTMENNICLRDIYSNNDDDCIHNFLGHENYINCLIKCNDNIFASASNDWTIRIWDYYKRKEIRTINAHEKYVLCLIRLENGYLCSGSADKSIKVWDWKNGSCLKSKEDAHTDMILSLCQFNDKILISASSDKSIKIWENFKCIGILNGHKNEVRILCKIDENLFASGSFDNTIKIWNLKEFNCFQTLEKHSSNVTSIIKLNKNSFASCSCDNSIIIWINK